MTNKINKRNATALAMFLASGSAMFAQVLTGSLSGGVKDNNGIPVSGAKVIIRSSQMMGNKEVTTAHNGEWRVPLLPPGNYRVIVAKDGYVSAGAENIRVGAGAAARQDFVLKLIQKAQAVVEVVASSQTVDKTDTKIATNYSAEDLATLPVADRSFSGALAVAPGVTAGNAGAMSIRGGTTQSTMYSVNGADVKDPVEGRITGTFLIEDNIEDVQVILSPLHARNGRSTSGGVNVVTKSGGNEFSGSMRATVRKDSWNAKGRADDLGPNSTTDSMVREYQVTLAGPIVKDRLWFSLGTILTPKSSTISNLGKPFGNGWRVHQTGQAAIDTATGTDRATGMPTTGSLVPTGYAWSAMDTLKSFTSTDESKYYEGKLTGAITTDHTVEFAYTHSRSDLFRNPFGTPRILRLAALTPEWQMKSSYSLNYRGMLTSSTFLEARYTKVDSKSQFPIGDPAYGSGETMLLEAGGTQVGLYGYGYPFGLQGCPYPQRRDNRSANVNLKMYRDAAGSHEIDLGVDFYQGLLLDTTKFGNDNIMTYVGGAYQSTSASATPNDMYLFPTLVWVADRKYGQGNGGVTGLAPVMTLRYGQDGTAKTQTTSAYANDTWTIDSHWNVMAGLRFDRMQIWDTDGSKLITKSDISPRLQVKYDLNGDSKHLLSLTAARYNSDFTLGFMGAFTKKADSVSATYGWGGMPGSGQLALPYYGKTMPALPTGTTAADYLRFVHYSDIMTPGNYTVPIGFDDSSKKYRLDPNLSAPYSDEITLGYRRSWDNGSTLRMTYIYKTFKNDWAFVEDYLPENWVEVSDPKGSGATMLSQTQYVTNSSLMKRTYNALELEWTSRLSSVWTFGGSWTYARLVGNNNGGDQVVSAGSQAFRDNGVSSLYDNRYWKQQLGISQSDYAPVGPLAADVRHRGRAFLTADLPLGKGRISYSWMLRYESGYAWSASSTAAFGDGTNIPYDPNMGSSYPATYAKFYGGRGQYSGNDRYYTDFKMAFNVPLGLSKLMLIGDLMVNNLFNHQQLLSGNHGIDALSSGSNYLNLSDKFGSAPTGEGTYYGAARSFQASLGLRF